MGSDHKNQKTQDQKGDIRARIKAVARDLFIREGLSEVTYGDIAEVVGTTRANLHYHFGNKSALIEEVFRETFESVDAKNRDIWLTPGRTLDERIRLTEEDATRRFYEFNTSPKGNIPWSLSARARVENSLLSPEIKSGIAKMSKNFEDYVAHAVQLAIGAGELRPGAPVRTIVMLITPIWYCGSPLTQFSGINKLKEHYAAVGQTIQAAYGMRPPKEPESSGPADS